MQHVFIIGSKSMGAYGGYETFVYKLTEYHKENPNIKYHVACKANGGGSRDESTLAGARKISDQEFEYNNAICFKIKVPEWLKSAQALYYDVEAIKYSLSYIKSHHIQHPIIYILACRIGPWLSHFQTEIHKLGGKLYINPDGHEWMRQKWSAPVRKYWKESERLMVKHSDLAICDSKNIEKYIQEEYRKYNPKTVYISYGSETRDSKLSDEDPKFTGWLESKGLKPYRYYLAVGRFVPENNYEIMIREFMKSHSDKDFAIITTDNPVFLNQLDAKLHFRKDKRIKFVGTVYDRELLKKIREQAYGYFHGHEVGGTNPSLLEALGSTRLNLLLDVGFNREVAEDSALYWTKQEGNLANLIDRADQIDEADLNAYGDKAKERILKAFSWQFIAEEYQRVWLNSSE
jgi:rhamnosyltransferase